MRPSEQLRFWAHELAAIARTGLEFTTNDYDRDRYVRTRAVAEGLASLTIDATFTPERPYLPDLWMATPKVGCSVAAFDDASALPEDMSLLQRTMIADALATEKPAVYQ